MPVIPGNDANVVIEEELSIELDDEVDVIGTVVQVSSNIGNPLLGVIASNS